MANLGKQLAQYERRAVSVTLFENGISIKQGQRRMESSWVNLARIQYQQTQVVLNGVPLPRSYVMQFVQPDRQVFTLSTRSEEEADLLLLALKVSTPALQARDLATFESGAEVDLGAVRISHDRLMVKNKSLPLAQFAGWIMRQGHLLIDRNRKTPRLWVEIPVGQVGNFFSLEAILSRVYQEGDLKQEHNAQNARRKASRAPWIKPSAVNRNPGGMTRRGWFFTLMFLPALFAIYALIALPFAISKESYADKVDARQAEVVAVAHKIAAELPRDDPAQLLPLEQACHGRLEYGPADYIAGYFAPLPRDIKARFGKNGRSMPHRRLVASNEWGGILAESEQRDIWDQHDLWTAWADILGEAPMDWDRRLKDHAHHHRDLSNTRYLAVAAVRSMELDRSANPIQARLFVQVVELSSKEVLCQGSVAPDLSGRGGYRSTMLDRQLLLSLCQVGGDRLCESAARRK